MTPKHGLYVVEVRLTRACNLACRHCSVSAGEAGEGELDTGEVKGLLDSIRDMDARYVTFTGGEPLLREDLPELVGHASDLGLSTALDTNGLLLNKDMAWNLKKAGLQHIQVSLDGMEKTHDAIRGKGAYKGAVDGIRNSLEVGVRTTINLTVSRLNRDGMEEVVKTGEEMGVDLVSLERFVPTGRGQDMMGPRLSAQDFKEVLEEFFSYGEKYGIRLATTDPLRVLLEERGEEVPDRICGGCTAGIAGLTVSYDGQVLTCPKVPVSVGNIRDRGIEEIWLDNTALIPLRNREFKGKCADCELVNLCGGCRAAALAETGDWLGEDPQCWM